MSGAAVRFPPYEVVAIVSAYGTSTTTVGRRRNREAGPQRPLPMRQRTQVQILLRCRRACRKERPSDPCAPAVSAQNVIEAAASLLRAGKYEEAIAPLLEAAALAPFNASVHSDLGLAYLYCHRPSEAVPWLRRSLALRPNFAATHYHLGTALEETGEDGEALNAYQRAIALDPKLAKAHASVATFLVAKGARRKRPRRTIGRLRLRAIRFSASSSGSRH